MDAKHQHAAYAAGNDPDVVKKLDGMLTGENDRAFIVCTFGDCVHNEQGRCTIFAVKDVPKMKRTAPCDRYQARNLQTPS